MCRRVKKKCACRGQVNTDCTKKGNNEKKMPVSKPAFSKVLRETGVSRCGEEKVSSNEWRLTKGMLDSPPSEKFVLGKAKLSFVTRT